MILTRRELIKKVGMMGGLILARPAPALANWWAMQGESISQPGGNDSDTVLLLHMDGADEGTTFTDSGAGPNCPHTINVVGNANTEQSIKKFGTASAEFDGTNDNLDTPAHADYDFSGDFTVDFWVRINDVTAWAYIVGNGEGFLSGSTIDQGWSILIKGDTYVVYSESTGVNNNIFEERHNTSWSNDTWYHVAVVRASSTVKIYVDGTHVSSSTTGSSLERASSNALHIGESPETESQGDLGGYVDELRISKGIARWTSDFTPYSVAYS